MFFLIICSTAGEYPPQIHIKPALDVQKMENIQICLEFLEHYGVSINGVTADGKKQRNHSFIPSMIFVFLIFCYCVGYWGKDMEPCEINCELTLISLAFPETSNSENSITI